MNETNGDTFYVDQEKDVEDDTDQSVDDEDNLSVNSWIMVKDDEDAAASPPPRKCAKCIDSSDCITECANCTD